MVLQHYTQSNYKRARRDVINAGTSLDNTKLVKLNSDYKNPIFYPRKFEKWPDTFEVNLQGDSILVRRTDVTVGGWGENLLIDVEFDIENSSNIPPEQKIPRVIYQTFENYDVPKGMYGAVYSWINSNPDYEHYFFNESDRISFIEKYFDRRVLNAYLSLIPGAFKADLWRCCVLYEKGGIYVDSDMICLKPLNKYIEPDDEFLISRDDPMSKKFLANGFIASTPKHPFLKEQIDGIVKNVEELRQCYYLDISGPALFGKSINKVLGRDIETEYELGRQKIGDFIIKIFEHDWVTKTFRLDEENFILTEYSGKNSEMDSINNPTFYSLYQNNIIYQRIPRNIYFTSLDHTGINDYMIKSFQEKNQFWKLNYFSDENCIDFFVKENENLKDLLGIDALSFFNSLENGGERSDFWRYCVIYLYGGFYTDTDTFCNISLNKWVKHHDLILGIEALLPLSIAQTFGMDKVGQVFGDKVVSVCNWSFGAEPKHNFFKNLILDIYNNPIKGNVLLNTGPGRITKHAINYFNQDINLLETDNIYKNLSVLFNINKFGSNQGHSNAYKNYQNPFESTDDSYIIHLFDGSWRFEKNKKIKTFKSNLGVSHNLTIEKISDGYIGVARLDKDTTRTQFMKCIGDCRSLIEFKFDEELNLISETEKPITNFNSIAKFEDFRFFIFNKKRYLSVSYIDENFNTKVGILDENYKFIGDVIIDEYNKVSWMDRKVIWEKNWLFFEKDNELFFIYSTMPNYTLFKCEDFNKLIFNKVLDTPWPLNENVPENEVYFTSYIGSSIKISTGGSTNPIFIKGREFYLYFIHTKLYNEKKYNHYAIILDTNLRPIKMLKTPTFHKYMEQELFFVSSLIETDKYFVFSGGIGDNTNFVWSLSKDNILNKIKI